MEDLDFLELEKLGCKMWSGCRLMLLPPEIVQQLPHGTKLVSINHREVTTPVPDLETRFGCTAYGVTPKPLNTFKIAKLWWRSLKPKYAMDAFWVFLSYKAKMKSTAPTHY